MLNTIVSNTSEEVKSRRSLVPISTIRKSAEAMPSAHDFKLALEKDCVAVIAEIKRKSPSRGSLREINAPALAQIYQSFGAAAISILTDYRFFGGEIADIEAVRKEVDLPLLRKDFVIDEYQIYEAKAAGADAFLLIAKILSDTQMKEYLALASDLHLGTLMEVHDEQEMERALSAGAPIIGINNRDLSNFTIDLAVTERLASLVPKDRVLVAESGIFTSEHVERVARAGAQAVLVGESLVRASSVEEKIRELAGVSRVY